MQQVQDYPLKISPYPQRYQKETTQETDPKINTLSTFLSYCRRLYMFLFLKMILIALGTFSIVMIPTLKSRFQETRNIANISIIVILLTQVICCVLREKLTLTLINVGLYILQVITVTFALSHLLFSSSLQNDLDYAMAYVGVAVIYLCIFVFLLSCKTEITLIGASFVVIMASLFIFQMLMINTQFSVEFLAFFTLGIIIWGELLLFDILTPMSLKRDKTQGLRDAVMIYSDIFYIILQISELFRQLLIKERNI